MSIEERVKQTLEENRESFANDPEFTKLQEFYLEMQRLGLVRQQEYDLPPLDTSGRRVYEMTESKTKTDSWLK